MCSWNIAGARDKLSQENFKKFLRQYDVIWILETKLIKSTEISGLCPIIIDQFMENIEEVSFY